MSILDRIPYARFLDIAVESTTTGIECVLLFRQEIVGNARLPAIHGSVLGAFMELTALMQLIRDNEGGRITKPINFGIDYLRSAGPRETRGTAEVMKLGRRVANVHVIAWQKEAKDGAGAFDTGTGRYP